jgi:hypothetical protein
MIIRLLKYYSIILGAPPAYPGLANRPVSNPNAPPAYSQSWSNPPAYSPGFARPPSYSAGYYNNYNNYKPNYGSSFGHTPLGSNTYIYNNYYGGSRSGGSSFLTSALFFGVGMHTGFGLGGHRRSWDENDDRRWRSTTKAPYFENKVPGSDSYLPAAAVVGAATAFGLASLLPLNVPANKPLMYCNGTDVAQSPIYLDFNIYSCINKSISVACLKSVNSNGENLEEHMMSCDVEQASENLYCTNGTLFSRSPIVCTSTMIYKSMNVNQTTLNCYHGSISRAEASFIPTTEAPIIATTERELSLQSKIHVFFMKLVGKSDIIERAQKVAITDNHETSESDVPRSVENGVLWVPEALTVRPELNSTEVDAKLDT